MSKITSVELQTNNPHRFNIFLDGQFAFGVDEDLVISRRLIVGKVISVSDLKKILFEAEAGKLMERMYRWFRIRQHSEKEVRDYFKIKNLKLKIKKEEPVNEMVIETLIKTLKKKGMINDLEFAKVWVEARRKSKQKGIIVLRMELFQKGINKEIIEQVLQLTDARSGQVSEQELARLALDKKIKVWKKLSHLEFKKKAYPFLLRRGFTYDISKNVIEKFLQKE